MSRERSHMEWFGYTEASLCNYQQKIINQNITYICVYIFDNEREQLEFLLYVHTIVPFTGVPYNVAYGTRSIQTNFNVVDY